jgi:hypothetical protein
MVIFTDESADLVGHPEQLFPLLPIKCDRESPQSVNRKPTLLADLERHLPSGFLQGFVLGTKPLNFCFQIFIGCHVITDSTTLSPAMKRLALRRHRSKTGL